MPFHASSPPAGSVPRALAAILLAAFLGTGPGLAAAAEAGAQLAAESRDYAIGPGALGDVLAQFAAQAGVALSFDPAQLAGLRSPGLHGRYTARQGFEALLADSGYELEARGGGYSLRLAPQPPRAVVELGTVHVQADAIKPEDTPYRTAGSSSYISRDDIERFRGTSVGDIFQGTPGVLVGENRNSGGLDVNIRGMQGQGRVPVLVDGARQETTVSRGYSGVSSRSYVDPDLIGGIEINKGPTLSAQGAGAVGGLVSMRTLNVDDIVRPGETIGLRLRGSAIGNNSGSPSDPGTRSGYGSIGGPLSGGTGFRTDCASPGLCEGHELSSIYGTDATMDRPGTFTPKSYAGSLAFAKRWEKVDLVAAYAQRSQGNYYAGEHGPTPALDLSDTAPDAFWTNVYPKLSGASRVRGGERVVNSNYESKSTLLKTRLYLPDDQELELSWLRYRSTYGQLMPSQLIWFGVIEQTENSKVTADTYTAKYHWQPAGNDYIDLRANLWMTDTDSLNRNYSKSMALLGGESYNSAEKYKRKGLDLTNTMRFHQWGEIKLDYGVSAQWENIGTTGEDADAPRYFFRNGTRSEYSVFAGLQWKPVDSLTFEGGLRYMRFKSHDDNATVINNDSRYCFDDDGDGQCDPVYYANRKSGTTPMLSLTWEPLAGLQFYGSYAEAMRMPSLFESSSGFSAAPTLDSNLRPEHAYNREIGVNYLKDGLWKSHDKFRLKLAYFRNTVRDYLTRTIPNTWEDTSTGVNSGFFRMRNIDKATFNGVELSGSYDVGYLFTQFGATRYTKIETCLTGSYRREPCTDYGIAASYINNMIPPNWHASLLVGARLFDRKLTLGLRGTFMGQRNRVPEYDNQTATGGIAFASPIEWHAYRIYDLFASYKVSDRLSIDFNIDNLTDRYYLDALSLGMVPAPGRTARLGVTLQF
ncbi:Heme/hemopexin utilization protein C precursor [Pigmentiphaga humi]|uniref:Heme/hemopexin utilization protein C n=1 Tax=Pigmentiphaga humi TaxID=2478468 RepID=A0A3P4AWP4_9BURK|nr:TonB-dependent receptor [Pigmentiphaga humi]VCU68457.1 Heme/hemopexin utilization protein C precursor [Pigmentiphaga humi]